MKKQLLYLTFLIACFILAGHNGYATPFQEGNTGAPQTDTGRKMNFQGTLYENGEPVNGSRTITFTIALDEGSWTETKTAQVIEGLYSVTLGSESPLPQNLFYGVAERNLTIKVGSSTLGTVKLYAPFSPKEIGPANDLPRRIDIDNAKVDSDTIFYFNISADNVTEGSQRGIQVDMSGAGFKIALRGNTLSQEGDATSKIAILGSATGAGIGSHEGVRGQAFGAGLTNNGILGLAGGPGNGVTGYETGSYNTGVIGYGQSNSWGNIGVSGWAVGSIGVDNIGVAGISAVGEEGNTEIENKGVLGRAEGLGINKAIWARAMNGVENWAGWFEGDVAIKGGSNLNLYGPNDDDSLRVQLNYFGPNESGSVLTFGHNNTRRALLGSDTDRTGGLLHLYDSLDRATVQLRATSRVGDWVTDKSAHGQLTLWGPNGQNFYLGAKVWEDGGADLPVFQMLGSAVEDPDNAGQFINPEGIFMSIENNGDGQQGMIQLGKEGEESVILNRDKLANLLSLTEANSFETHNTEGVLKSTLRFDADQNAGILELFGSQEDPDVKMGSFGTTAGGRLNLYQRSDDNSYIRSAITSAAYGEGMSYVNLYSENLAADNTVRLVDLYTYNKDINDNPYSNGYKRSGVDFYDNEGTRLIALGSDRVEAGADPTGKSGFLYLSGTNSPNVELSGKRDENNDLGAIRLYGTTTDGGSWYRSNASIEVNSDGTNEWGRLSLSLTNISNSTTSENIAMDGNTGNITISGSLSQSSDRRLKKNITTLTSGLALVNSLRGVRYNWKDETRPENKIGFIAQELEEVLPELVTTKADGFKAVNYAEMTAVLVEAVKELTQQIADLKKENTSLKAELTGVKDMEDRLAKIEAMLGTASNTTTKSTDKK